MAVIMRDAIKPEPAADAREHPGARARRPVRQHRHRQLVDRRRPDRHPQRRLPHHRGRLRRRHGRRAVLQHQVPRLGPRPRRGRAGGNGSGPQGALRQAQDRGRQATARRPARREPRRRAAGGANLRKQIENVQVHGVTPVVAINVFPADHDGDIDAIREIAERWAPASPCRTHFSDGGAGATELATPWSRRARRTASSASSTPTTISSKTRSRRSPPRSTAPSGVEYTPAATKQLDNYEATASATCRCASPRRTCRSPATPSLKGAPTGHTLPVREVRASVGAGFVYPICGAMSTMPGLGTDARRRANRLRRRRRDRRAVLTWLTCMTSSAPPGERS